MKLIEKITAALFSGPKAEPKADEYPEGVLRFKIEELPNPRDTGTLYISCGKRLITTVDVTLDAAGLAASCSALTQKSDEIRKYSYSELGFANIAPWARSQLEAHLSTLGLAPQQQQQQQQQPQQQSPQQS